MTTAKASRKHHFTGSMTFVCIAALVAADAIADDAGVRGRNVPNAVSPQPMARTAGAVSSAAGVCLPGRECTPVTSEDGVRIYECCERRQDGSTGDCRRVAAIADTPATQALKEVQLRADLRKLRSYLRAAGDAPGLFTDLVIERPGVELIAKCCTCSNCTPSPEACYDPEEGVCPPNTYRTLCTVTFAEGVFCTTID